MKFFKVSFIAIGALIFSSNVSFAQFSASFSAGYGAGVSQQSYYDSRYRDANTNTREVVKYSLGSGLNFNGNVNYGLSDNLEVGLDFSYLMGSSAETTDYDGRDPAAIQNDVYTIKGSGFSFTPNLMIKGSGEGIKPYSKVGMIAGFYKTREEWVLDDGTNVWELDVDYTGKMSLGLSGSVGAMYSLGAVDLYGELFVNSVSYAPERSEIVRYDLNGVNQLSNFNVNDLQTVYLDQIDRNKNIPNDQPDEALQIFFPFSSYGLKVGVRYSF